MSEKPENNDNSHIAENNMAQNAIKGENKGAEDDNVIGFRAPLTHFRSKPEIFSIKPT